MKCRRLIFLFLFLPVFAWSESKLTISKTSFLPGEKIEVRYSTNRPPLASAWVGVIPSNVPHGNESVNDAHDVSYQYIQQTEGTTELPAPLAAGAYDIRMNYD